MKIDRLDAHDRLQEFKKQSLDISECCLDLVNKRPFGDTPFYIFAHARTEDDGVSKRIIWQPRLTRPKPQTNSMLFKGYPGSDLIKMCWMIPAREMWDQYKKGNLTEHSFVCWSIDKFENERALLEQPEDDDLNDDAIDKIYESIGRQAKFEKAGYTLI